MRDKWGEYSITGLRKRDMVILMIAMEELSERLGKTEGFGSLKKRINDLWYWLGRMIK